MRTRIALAVAGAGCAFLFPGIAPAAPGLSVSPTTVVFGSSCVGAPAAARQITMTNDGDEPLSVGQIVLTGVNPQDFTLSNAQARTIPAGGSSTFGVGFLPRAAGDRSGIVRIDSNAGGPVEISVSGRGATRLLDISPERLTFGDQRVGSADDELSLSIVSTGNDPVRITGVSVTGPHLRDFSTKGPSSSSLSPGARTAVSVGFRPGGVGGRAASITIDSDACVGRVVVPVEGTGTAPDLKVNPSPIDLGDAPVGLTAQPVPVVLTNAGRAPLRIARILVEGDHASDFRFDSLPATPKILGAGDEIPLTATFTPTAAGPRSAVLRIESDDPDTPVVRVQMSGNVAGASASPSGSASPSASPTVSRRPSPSPRPVASRGGMGDWIAVAIVLLGGGGAFAGLIAVARRKAPER